MQIGVPKEIKAMENRVALTPDGARRLVADGHEVRMERGAGVGSGFEDAAYVDAGATLVGVEDAWRADLVVKVKEPVDHELDRLGTQWLFTYLHLAGVTPTLTDRLLAAGTTAIAYETVEDADGTLPLLAPMSAVAGAMAPIVGGWFLGRPQGGRGVLPARVQGDRHGDIVVIGDGVVGRHAAAVALGLGSRVTLFSRREERRAALEKALPGVRFALSSPEAIGHAVAGADLVVGGVYLRGGRAPWLVTDAMVAGMQPGSVIVDVSIDQGGCVETSTPTTHAEPTTLVHDVVHYAVTNMPGAYPRTSTVALTDATLPYVRALARDGLAALEHDPGFAKGLMTHDGRLRCRAVADSLGRPDLL